MDCRWKPIPDARTIPTPYSDTPTHRHNEIDVVIHEAGELAFRLKLANAKKGPEKDLVQVERDLALVLRVADLQATELEVRDFGPRLNQFVALCRVLLSTKSAEFGTRNAEGGFSSIKTPSSALRTPNSAFDEPSLRQLISSSIDYYVMA